MIKFFQNIAITVFSSLLTMECLAQAGSAHFYVGVYDNLDKDNLQSTLLGICSRYEDYRFFISNDQFPLIITNQSDLNNFFRDQILLLNPTYPNIYFEIDTMLKLDSKNDFLSFDAKNQPRVNKRVDYYFFLPNLSAPMLIKELVYKYYQIMGFGDVENLEENISITIYSKEMLLNDNSNADNSTFIFNFKTY